MRPAPDYIGPAWITRGEHRGRLAMVDHCDDPSGATAMVMDGDRHGIVCHCVTLPLDALDMPAPEERAALEERIWRGVLAEHFGQPR